MPWTAEEQAVTSCFKVTARSSCLFKGGLKWKEEAEVREVAVVLCEPGGPWRWPVVVRVGHFPRRALEKHSCLGAGGGSSPPASASRALELQVRATVPGHTCLLKHFFMPF